MSVVLVSLYFVSCSLRRAFCWFNLFFFFFKQKTAYEMRISDWSSDVCSSDLVAHQRIFGHLDLQLPGFEGMSLQDLTQFGHQVRQTELGAAQAHQIGRASCRERVCQYV